MHYSTFYNIMPDGTVKQINPFTGNEVWAVPGRASKPTANGHAHDESIPLSQEIDHGAVCSFCERRYLEVPPEKARIVRTEQGDWNELVGIPPESYFDTTAEFRRVANLFEIVTLEYWKKNYGYRLPPEEEARLASYASSPGGMEHLREIIAYKLSFRNGHAHEAHAPEDLEVLSLAEAFFGGCHELIIARRHYVERSAEPILVSSGLLTPEEHHQYARITIDALRDIVARNRYVRYVSVFQNWLRNAGASFDHLHRQLVGLDEWGASITRQVKMLKDDPNVFNEYGANFAAMYNLVFAENDHALAFVGIGHRFPTIEIFSKSRHSRPYEHDEEELRGMSDLVHACHAAMGPEISCNEEWYYTPVDAVVKMPWHVLIKWRINVTAGFEGGTSIFINPMTPVELRDRMVPRMYALRESNGIAPGIRIAEECHLAPNPLQYYRS